MKKISLIILSALLLAGCQITSPQSNPTSPDAHNQDTQAMIEEQQENQIGYQCEAGKSAFEVLLDKVGDANVTVKEFSFGKQVTAINGIEQGDNKFWLYSIDNQEATTSADTYTCQGEEQIVWELK
jgi:hypothetical protein